MISVPVGTGNICFAHDISCGYDIRFAYEGTDITSYCDEEAIYHAVRQRGISYGVAVYHFYIAIDKFSLSKYNERNLQIGIL